MSMTFNEILNVIRTAVYGAEVREGIAQGMEQVKTFRDDAAASAAEAAASLADAMIARGSLSSGDDLDTITDAGMWYVNTASYPTSWPVSSGYGRLIVFGSSSASYSTKVQLVVLMNKRVFVRIGTGSAAWSGWAELTTEAGLETALAEALVSRGSLSSGNDIDAITSPGTWYFIKSTENQYPVNWPTDHVTGTGRLIVFGSSSTVCSTKVQLIVSYGRKAVFRIGTAAAAWSDWTDLLTNEDLAPMQEQLDAVSAYVGTDLAKDMTVVSHGDSGVTWTFDYDARTVRASGTASATSYQNIYNNTSALPAGMSPGQKLYVKYSAENINLRLTFYGSGGVISRSILTGDAVVTVPAGAVGALFRYDVTAGVTVSETVALAQVRTSLSTGELSEAVSSGTTAEELRVLVFGSSFSYSTLGYVPTLLEEAVPGLRVTLGICYDSGQTLAGHIARFSNDTAYTQYSEYTTESGKWTNTAGSVTGRNALAAHDWDIIVLQQACRNFTYGTSETAHNYTDLETLADIIQGLVNYPMAFVLNMIQVLGANCTFPDLNIYQGTGEENSAVMFGTMSAYARRAMEDHIVLDVLPGGTAVQNARENATLKEIGTTGYLCCDVNGHLQNGLGPLVAGYANACRLLQLAGRVPKIFGYPYTPTNAQLAELDYMVRYVSLSDPRHGECTGVSAENMRLAQKAAMAAIRNPYEVTAI